MKYRYHVYTAMWRLKNIPRLVSFLAPLGITWHLTYDKGVSYAHPDLPWIKAMTAEPPPPGWHPSSWKDNWFLDHTQIDDLGRYCHLSDDDWYEPEFFQKLDRHDGDVLIVTMQNGPTPEGPRQTLHARPECVRGGRIGAQQLIACGYIARFFRYGKAYAGDWDFISAITQVHPPEFVPEASVYWNHL